jgi:inner membrane protein
MDSLTHTVIGAVVGDAFAGRRLGKKAMLWGALINNLPDIDVLTSLWMTQAEGLLAHRGFTHSIVFMLLMTPLVAYGLHRRYRTTSSYQDWLWLSGSNLFIHLFIDALTAYGTGWFEPFSHHRVSFNLFFVADPLYTLPFLISAVALLILRRSAPGRIRWHRIGIFWGLAYLVFACWNKFRIDRQVTHSIAEQQLPVHSFITTPTPLNNLLWYVIARSDTGYYIGYRSVLDRQDAIPFTYFSRNDSLLTPWKHDPEVDRLVRFSQGLYRLNLEDGHTVFSDMRFGQIGGWMKPEANFVFRFYLDRPDGNDLVIQRGRMEASTPEALRSLWKRIQGDS